MNNINKMHKLGLILAVVALVAVSCSSEKKDDSKSEVGKEENAQAPTKGKVMALDKDLMDDEMVDEKKAKEFIGMCMEYADANPDDKDSPMLLEKAALMAGGIKKYKLKTQLFQFIIDKYPAYHNYDNIIYLQAMAWDSEMKDAATAKKYYLMVMEQHKDSGILASAEARLETIDSLSYDQNIERLVKKMKDEMPK